VTRLIQEPGPKPGQCQRPRRPRPMFRRVWLERGENEPTYYWDEQGLLFHDYGCTKPAGLMIVAYEEDEDD
jgi:hypothetical protein